MTPVAAALLSALIALFVGVFVRFDWTPKVKPTLSVQWVDPKRRRYVLRLELENTSNVSVIKRACHLQVLEHSREKQPNMSELVQFDEKAQDVFTSTDFLYPGEKISVERLGQIDDPDIYLHVGLQFEGHLPLNTRIAFKLQKKALRFASKLPNERWTTTAFVYPPADNEERGKS